jgi:undecaprenyl pyrophosphate phosphatase UppP
MEHVLLSHSILTFIDRTYISFTLIIDTGNILVVCSLFVTDVNIGNIHDVFQCKVHICAHADIIIYIQVERRSLLVLSIMIYFRNFACVRKTMFDG